jgi:3-hydroxyisobutyrate dehydrogenase
MVKDVGRSIGWIGAGRMGSALIERLLEAGVAVAVFNRTRSKADALAAMGATAVRAPVDLAQCDVVFTMVSASKDLLDVTTGPSGLLTDDNGSPAVLVDCSTVSIETSQAVRAAAEQRGTSFVAAPVSGNPKVVRAGRASFAVSGPVAACDQIGSLLAALGRAATYVGDADAARVVKIAHNLVLAIVAQAMAETAVVAEAAGVSRTEYLSFLNDSVLGSEFTRYKTPAFVSLDFTPTFTPALLAKDLDLGLAMADALDVAAPLVRATRHQVQRLIDRGNTDVDFAALLLLEADDAGVTLRAKEVPGEQQ